MLIIIYYLADFQLSLIIFANFCYKSFLNALLIRHGRQISAFGKRITVSQETHFKNFNNTNIYHGYHGYYTTTTVQALRACNLSPSIVIIISRVNHWWFISVDSRIPWFPIGHRFTNDFLYDYQTFLHWILIISCIVNLRKSLIIFDNHIGQFFQTFYICPCHSRFPVGKKIRKKNSYN